MAAIVLCIGAALVFPMAMMPVGWVSPSLRPHPTQEFGAETSADAAPLVNMIEWGKFQDPVGNCDIHREEHRAQFTLPGSLPYNLFPANAEGISAECQHDEQRERRHEWRPCPGVKAFLDRARDIGVGVERSIDTPADR